MPSPFSLIGNAWNFYRKHPVLNAVTFWLLFLPWVLLDSVLLLLPHSLNGQELVALSSSDVTKAVVGIIVGMSILILLALILCLGAACTLLVGKRIIMDNKAGRNRTSFKAVQKQARRYVLPLLLTEILADCTTILWGMLLIIPGIIYATRIVFFPIIIVLEEQYYRDALRRSQQYVRGQTKTVLVYFLIIALTLYAPIGIIEILSIVHIARLSLVTQFAYSIFINGAYSMATALFLLTTVFLFAEIRQRSSTPPLSKVIEFPSQSSQRF